MGWLEDWQIEASEIDEILAENPSLRGIIFGYIAEHKLRKQWLPDARFEQLRKEDDHDRRKKGDLTFEYSGVEVRVEVKSLQTHTVREVEGKYYGQFQCDASDRRKVTLPNEDVLTTTNLVVGEFDLLAVNLWAFKKEWLFAFARNRDLPRSRFSKYTPQQREFLLATLMDITWPLAAPYRDEPFSLIDEIAEERKRGKISPEPKVEPAD